MELLSEDDLNLKDMTPEELDLAWDLWFDLAQSTNDSDPPWTHGVFVLCDWPPVPDRSGNDPADSGNYTEERRTLLPDWDASTLIQKAKELPQAPDLAEETRQE